MTEDKQIHLYGAINKFDACEDGSLLVSGIASTESIDADGEVITADAMRKAIPSYLQTGTVREMHQPIAAGTPISAFVDDDGKTHFTAKIVDKGTIDKIKAGVLKGFSVGGKALKKVGNKITELFLKDISVVDLPNNPEAVFTVIKFDKPNESKEEKEKELEEAEKKLSEKHKKEKSMNEEAIKKLDSLAATVDSLVKTVETLSKPQKVMIKIADQEIEFTPEVIGKVMSDVGDLQKKATEAQKQIQDSERNQIIVKMDSEGRVAFNPDTGIAYTAEEIQKMDLNMLKFAAKNSPVILTQARAIYKGNGKQGVDPTIKGSEKVLAVYESQYPSLDVVKSRMNVN